ncbi:MAG: class I SAM-dependent methyltransferase [Acidobacteriota bacterium]
MTEWRLSPKRRLPKRWKKSDVPPGQTAVRITIEDLTPPSQSWYLDPLVAQQKGAIFLDWILRSIGTRIAEDVLKTDVFEEANGQDRILDTMFPAARHKVGIDIEQATVHKAQRIGGGFLCLCADCRALPFPSDSFDVVVSTSTLDHFDVPEDLPRSLKELTRVVRPGGTLLVILDNPYNPLYHPLYHPLKWITRRGLSPFRLGHTISRRRLASELRSAGMEIQGMEYLIHNPRLISTAVYLCLRRVLGQRADLVIRFLLASCELLNRLPTRGLTGCFGAVSARKPGPR